MDIWGFFLPTALSQLSTVKMGDVVSFSPLSGSPMLLVCLVVLLLTCRLDYGDVFSELNVWRQWETNKMIRVIGCGHLEKGGNEWNSERKGVFSWKGACVLVKVLLRVEKIFTMQVLEMAENGLCKWQFLLQNCCVDYCW